MSRPPWTQTPSDRTGLARIGTILAWDISTSKDTRRTFARGQFHYSLVPRGKWSLSRSCYLFSFLRRLALDMLFYALAAPRNMHPDLASMQSGSTSHQTSKSLFHLRSKVRHAFRCFWTERCPKMPIFLPFRGLCYHMRTVSPHLIYFG